MVIQKLVIFPVLCLVAVIPLLAPPLLGAQTPAQEIEALLAAPAVSYAQAARLVLDASESFSTNNPNEAFQFASQNKFLPKNARADDKARLDGVALLLMKSFGEKGGIFYSLTGAAHYAYRELAYKNVIIGRSDPAMSVSGERLLFMINRMLAERDSNITAAERRSRESRAEREAREAAERREALAAEITAILEEHEVSDTTVEATEEGVTITLSNIQFYADSARLNASEQSKIQEIANILKNLPGIKLLVSGHTALAGDETGRNALSLARAQTVADYLVELGACDADNITAEGFGAGRPVADNDTPEGMAANRRVEITILE